MSFAKSFLLFLLINFLGLWVGVITQGDIPSDSWYQSINKAPWTPPGWVFGAAWFSIMVCFSIYLAYLKVKTKASFNYLFGIAFLLNVSWNPVFFYFHWIWFGWLILVLLTVVVFIFFIKFYKVVGSYSFLLLPYLIWMLLACSLNGYVLLNN